MKFGDVCAVVGAQYGSEGKGLIVSKIANQFGVHIRTGGPNAGHSFFHNGKLYKQQSVPVGWVNPEAFLVIGPGAVVHLPLLVDEINTIRREAGIDILPRLWIDRNASVLTTEHRNIEGETHGHLHQRIGSTGEGVGACRIDRILRDPVHPHTFETYARNTMSYAEVELATRVTDTVEYVHECRRAGKNILLEGTQGSGLSLTHGPWPYVTSHDTNAAQLAADAGIPPSHVTKCILVARTFPIRVAGNSGPLHEELSWKELSARLGRDVEEKTTVTKKIRRVGHWDDALFQRACMLNEPTSIALTFADYINGNDFGKTEPGDLSGSVNSFIKYVESLAGRRVSMVGTGPNTVVHRGIGF